MQSHTKTKPTSLTKFYVVYARFGDLGCEATVSDNSMDRRTVVRHLADMEWDEPDVIIEVDVLAGTSADITAQIVADAINLRESEGDFDHSENLTWLLALPSLKVAA